MERINCSICDKRNSYPYLEVPNISFSEPVKLSNIDEGTNISLDLCKVDENYELTSINLSK